MDPTEYDMGDDGQDINEDEMDYSHMQHGYDVDENGEYSQFAFPSFSPTSRKRVRLRKPNFSEDCIDLLIQLVNEHRDILYTKKAYTNDVHEKKIMVWTHVTSKINAISSIPRTMEEVRKKWNDYSYYVKKKRENEKRGIHYTPDTRSQVDQAFEEEQMYNDERETKTGKRDSKRIRRREDRVLNIVDNAQREAAMGGRIDDGMGDGSDNMNSMLLDACQRARSDSNYGENDDESESENLSRSSTPPIPKNIPRSTNVPPLPNPISSYGYGRGKYSKYAKGREQTRKSSRVRNPVKPFVPNAPTGRGRGRGRGMVSPAMLVSPVDEDLVLVNRQMLSMERKMLNVEKSRMRVEMRRLQIEEERFKWEQIEREKIYLQNESEANQNRIGEEQGQESNAENLDISSDDPQQNQLSLQQVCSPVKYETQSPDAIQQSHSPIVISTEAPSLTPIDESF